ncbi:Transposase, partial [Fusarium oxysporum f. sp. albedinis]
MPSSSAAFPDASSRFNLHPSFEIVLKISSTSYTVNDVIDAILDVTDNGLSQSALLIVQSVRLDASDWPFSPFDLARLNQQCADWTGSLTEMSRLNYRHVTPVFVDKPDMTWDSESGRKCLRD